MKQKFLIFLDIDGTLIKENQKPNTSRLPAVIKKLERKGFVFGLNSNRSFEDIISVYTNFGLNGPIVLENGVYFKKNLESKRVFLANTRSRIQSDLMRASKQFVHKKGIDAQVLCLDTVSAITAHPSKSKGVVIMINKYRLFTGSLHIYRDGVRDRGLAKDLAKYLRKYFKSTKKNMTVVVPEAFGNIVVYPNCISKTKALAHLRVYYPECFFAMIGDDDADADTLKEVDYFFAVGNATISAKRNAKYVAKGSHTKGVIDILQHMEKNVIN